ncbi:hypothetical protein HORM4_660121 [Vibrio harveyi]|nr:hypothetical protein HORM4_660121 [Vibrio harveyi]
MQVASYRYEFLVIPASLLRTDCIRTAWVYFQYRKRMKFRLKNSHK